MIGKTVQALCGRPVLLATALALLAQGIWAGSNVWQTSFDQDAPGALPKGWKGGGGRGVPKSSYMVVTNATGAHILHMEANKSSSVLMHEIKKFDLRKAPYMRWKWRALELPTGGDGRVEDKGDQPIHIYVISGGMAAQRCVSYTWETETPHAASHSFSLFMSVFEDTWWCIRNKTDGTNVWYTEERNVGADFQACYGSVRESVAIMVCCKADKTASRSAAELEWLTFSNCASSTNKP